MMPAILLRFLPHLIVIAAVLSGLAWVYHSGGKAMEQRLALEREVQARITIKAVRDSEQRIAARLGDIDSGLGDVNRQIDTAQRTIIQPTIEREIIRETRLSDPAAGLTPGLLDAVNAARRLSCRSGPDGSVACPVPAAAAGP